MIGRFSLGGGHPDAADSPNAVRGLGLQFSLPDGELWRTAMIHLPVFPFNTPEAFYEQMFASKPDPGTGKPDPARMSAFLARHPETVQAMTVIKGQPLSSGFDNSTFHGLNAFRFINSAGDSIPVRWQLSPAQPFEAASGSAVHDRNYLFDSLIAQIHRQPLRWHLIVIIGQPDDPTNDATIAWPARREQVDVGTLTLDRVESDDTSAATDINFDPLVLPAGIAPSDDPLLSARSAVYSQSFTRRAGETKQPSAITPSVVAEGRMRMSTQRLQFTAFSRLLHWTMAAMVLTMLCIGVAMVASLADYHVLVSIHRPLGIAILILVVIRFMNRLLNPPPPLPGHDVARGASGGNRI